jgi:hypothetical protein
MTTAVLFVIPPGYFICHYEIPRSEEIHDWENPPLSPFAKGGMALRE